MFDPSVTALFPLPLTTFEKYMLWDDRPEYPMVFALQLKLCGELRRAVFESSLAEALLHHPLLCATVKESAQSGPTWRLAEGLGPVVDWDALGVAIGNPRGERIDLSSEVGLRIWVRQGDGAAEVTLQFHHACCDGIGALRFVGHVLAGYGMRTASADRRPTLQRSDPAGLLRRGQFAAQPPAEGSRARAVWASVRDGLRWVGRRPTILCPRGVTTPAAASLPFPETYRHTFDASETERIRQAGTRRGATVNDLLLRDMFQTLHQWNAGRESGSAEHWLRIAVPVNLKTGDDDRMSAANGVSYTFLTRLGSQCADSQELLRSICRETDVITRRRRAVLFLRGFQLMERIPGAIPLYMRANRCFATVVLSNLGDLSRHFGAQFPCEKGKIVAGNVILEEVFGAAPVRANTRATFLIGRYGERLWVCVRCDPRVFPAADAHRLLSSYVDRLKRTVAEVTVDEKET